MNWDARKYFDKEAREKLRASIPDESLLAEVEAAYQDSINAIERQEAQIQNAHINIAKTLAQVSELSGVSQIHLLIICRRIAVTSLNVEWYQVLSTINSFYRIKNALETEES